MAYTSDRTLYHDGNGNVSAAGGAGWELLVRKGGALRDADAARFGLLAPPKRTAAGGTTPADAASSPAARPRKGG